MPESAKQQSNPFSTGGGGVNFETRIQAAFTVLMLSGRLAPCLPPFPITKIKLQGHYAGFNTDDFIVFTKQSETQKEAKLLAQIKHDVSITPKDTTFAEVIQSTWNDFNDESFDSTNDALALITGPLSATDINDVRPILEWARHCEDEKEFFTKMQTAHFSSNAKRTKLETFKTHLKNANGNTDVLDRQVWEFLKVFHIIGYDLDTESGSTLSLLHALIAQYSNKSPSSLWARVVDAVQSANQNAGTITLETLPEDIRSAFNTVDSSYWISDFRKLKEHGDYILDGIRTTIGGFHVKQSDAFATLLNLAETSSFVFVSGERGAGKSSLIREFSDYMGEHAPLFCLRTEDLEQPHLDSVFSAMGLRCSLRDLEAGFALMPKKYLVVESLEKLLELEKTAAFKDLLRLLNKHQHWTVIATGRDYAYQQIIFNYLQPFGINCTTLTLHGFSNTQVDNLCEQIKPLQKIADNSTLKELLKTPFFADLAYRVLQTGTEFIPEDGEREFRVAVWRDVIAKEQERVNGMPIRRKQAFVGIAVSRAKRMVYGVPESEFDDNALLKLEEDNLLRRDSKNGLVSPAHDVLEDWALDQYIEDAYQRHLGNTQNFLDAIGHEPAINRAFRLWLYQKLRDGKNVDDFVLSVIRSQTIQKYWQDETIAAVLQGNNPDDFLKLLRELLLSGDGEVLKRFCFILRIACQTPDRILTPEFKENDERNLVETLFLKPYGQGWKAILCFLLVNKNSLPLSLTSHITAVLADWSSLLKLNEDLPALAREAGLLALHLLMPLRESYRDDGDRKKLLSIIIKTIPVIHEDFLRLLENDVFVSMTDEEAHSYNYVEEFCKLAFEGVETAFFCKYDPDTLIKLAHLKWLIKKSNRGKKHKYRGSTGVNHHFRLHEHRYEFYPASGAKGPFKYLLDFHLRKGLDFILELLNIAAEEYAYSHLDVPNSYFQTPQESSEPALKPLTIQLNDGTKIQQYWSGRLWNAYRGHTVVPYLLQCALMALENWVILCVEYGRSDQVEWLFDYILRNSNSVMPTAVLASVASGFPKKVGKSALPLLRTPELYHMDRNRIIHEQGEKETNWHRSYFQRDPLSEVYAEERRIAALRPWRREHLETLIVRFQFSEWRDEALAAIDLLRTVEPQDESMRFLLHRIDSRSWRTVEDKENNRIIFESGSLEPDLENIQQQAQETLQLQERFSALFVWTNTIFKREQLESEYYATWHEALAEAKELHEHLRVGAVNDLASMYFGSIITAAAIFIRDYSSELAEEDVAWCSELIAQAVTANADTENLEDKIDREGAVAGASVIPILLDYAFENQDKLIVKQLIAIALTHSNTNVRSSIAEGIRNYLWQRDSKFAQQCIIGAVEYARFEREQVNQFRERPISGLEGDTRESQIAKLQAKKDEFRDRFLRGDLSAEFEQITLKSHNSWYLLSPCLMIPDSSRDPNHIALLLKIFTLFFETDQQEQEKQHTRDRDIEINVEIRLSFTERFANYLFYLHDLNFKFFLEKLRRSCNIAPDFMDALLLQVALVAERANKKEVYWQLWKELSSTVQKIAIEIADNNSNDRQQDKKRKLIRGMLHADSPWQKVDYENQDIALGKTLLLEFVRNAGNNPDVFESLASLMYHFPSIFFESAIVILSQHQKEVSGTRLLLGRNAAFYVERAIQRFLQLDHTGALPRVIHESCLVLLNAIVENASARAYYLRESLIRSRRILQV